MGSRGYGEGTPNASAENRCILLAAGCRGRNPAQISDRHLKAVYLRIADLWSVLARSYEFADLAECFLLDAKRTKDADARQPSRELVLLPSSLASGEVEHLLRPPSDLSVSGGTMRVVPEGGHPGAIAA
jgi:hypothetical protein